MTNGLPQIAFENALCVLDKNGFDGPAPAEHARDPQQKGQAARRPVADPTRWPMRAAQAIHEMSAKLRPAGG